MPELLNAPVTATDDAGKFAIDPSSKKKRFRLASFWAVDDAKTVFKDPSAPFISFFSTEKAALKTLIDALEKSEVTHGSREFNYVLWKTYLEPAFSAVATRPSKEGDA